MKKKNILFVLLWLVLSFASYWYYSKVIYPARKKAFHENELSGVIAKVNLSSGGLTIRLMENEEEYHHLFIHRSKTDKIFKTPLGVDFEDFVARGDSIYKAPFDEQLRIFKDGDEYWYKTNAPDY